MEKLLLILFVGTSKTLAVAKAVVWLMATLILVSLIENGGNDGKIAEASVLVLALGFLLTVLSVALSVDHERELQKKRETPTDAPAPIASGFNLPPVGAPVNYPTEPMFPDYPINKSEKGGEGL